MDSTDFILRPNVNDDDDEDHDETEGNEVNYDNTDGFFLTPVKACEDDEDSSSQTF